MAENGNSGIGDYQELLEAILHEIRQYRSFVETRMEPILVSIRDTLTSRLPTPPPVPAPTPAAVASVARPAAGIEDRRADLTIFLMVMSAIQMYASYLLNLRMQNAV
ncbi:uncharacterized protein LOC110695726 [Chenopodium quinoa]|uniref:uncharacterized protein LOC110695726 n=1 Tax=Chenopodium quinoa TaxID=63459 RepID=UPI000B795543|nr:uncharacterized protein LOC110695726 [Chenopodium quinoa]